jgi:hypothetical protein
VAPVTGASAETPAEVVGPPVVAEPAEPPPPRDDEPASLIGWWRSDAVCLELFASGDFELSSMASEPKVMVMGKATVTAADGGFDLQLATERIWKGRYVSSCRKHHETGRFIDERDMLGVTFKPGTTSALKLKRVGEGQVELCGTACQALTRATPRLAARWRREQLDYPGNPEFTWAAGEFLELNIDEQLGHVWVGLPDAKFATVYAKVEAKYAAPDRFTVTVTPDDRMGDAKLEPTTLGVKLTVHQPLEFAARRLAGERVELCGADGCATLGRQFDAYHYDLD